MSKTPKNYEAIAAKAPTALHEAFAQWIYEQTGFRPDLKSVQLAVALRMDYQASPENQADLAERKRKAAAAKKASAAAKKAKLEAQLAKLKADLEKVETEPAAADQPAVETAPVEDKPKTTRSRARKATATASEAPAQPKARTPRTRKTAVANPPAPVGEDFDRVDLDEPATKPVRRTRRTAATKTATATK
ncbi:hypothetical protein [Streptomyces malaysiensis]|uniref:Uncharacterized protein n=1 Tax=Streptomyces malaysiensis TaxID=92644 RepID=A0A2J7Z8G9_STRMQ|nr:hypothetical protein [Streptomyces malaysiensis]PNG96568.1 hypothetical protein SMF913_12593 [Streptomyces malaysiensis]